MTPQEHYEKAEELLASMGTGYMLRPEEIAVAQVHATLATVSRRVLGDD